MRCRTCSDVSDSTESGKLSFDIGGPGTGGTTVALDDVSIKAGATAIAPAAGKVRKSAPLAQVGNRLVLHGEGEVALRDLTGRALLSKRVSGESSLELASLPRGVFTASFQGTRLLVRHLE